MTLDGQNALRCRIDTFSAANAQIWMKTDPYYQRQKCRPIILVSGNIKYIDSRGFVLAGASNESGVVDDGNFWRFEWIFRDKASSIIWRYATPCRPETDCKMNDLEWLFDVKIRFWPTLCCRIDTSFAAHCTNLNEDRSIAYYQRQKCRPMTLQFLEI